MTALNIRSCADGAVRSVTGAVAQAEYLHAHGMQGIDGTLDAPGVGFHQMGSSEYRPDGLSQQGVDMTHHIQNAGVGAAHQNRKASLHFQSQTESTCFVSTQTVWTSVSSL